MAIVITGASVGIGAATARRFALQKSPLVLLARRIDRLNELKEELGHSVICKQLDVTSRTEVEEMFKQIGPIDLLVNNAGAALGVDLAQNADLDEWEQMVEVNIKGLIRCTHAVLPQMVQRNRGHIINLGSIAGTYPYPGGSVYCGTKAFVHQFSLCLKADLIGTQVRVSCIEPGLTGGTEFSKVRFHQDEKKVQSLYERSNPLQPEDIAEAIYFCATLPSHVNINTLEIMPTSQAPTSLKVFKKDSD